MKLTAIRNFLLLDGEHIATGTTFEVGPADAARLIALKRAVAATESIPVKKGKQ